MCVQAHSVIRRILSTGIVLSIYVIANLVFQPAHTVQAAVRYQENDPNSGSSVDDSSDVNSYGVTEAASASSKEKLSSGDPFDLVNSIVFKFVKVVIKFMYMIMILAFIVGSVKNASFSIVAQKFGMATMMSNELMNLIVGVVLFIGGLFTLPAVNWVIDESAKLINTIVISIPDINPSIS